MAPYSWDPLCVDLGADLVCFRLGGYLPSPSLPSSRGLSDGWEDPVPMGSRPHAHGPPCPRGVPCAQDPHAHGPWTPWARASQAETTLIYILFTVLVSFSLSICTSSCLSSVESPNRQVFIRRKRQKAGDDEFQPPAGQGQEEGSRGGGRPRRLATAKAPVETDSSYEESDSEGAYQPAAHETAEASQETGFVEEDEDDDEESSSPGERPLPGGRDVSNIPVNEWTQPEY